MTDPVNTNGPDIEEVLEKVRIANEIYNDNWRLIDGNGLFKNLTMQEIEDTIESLHSQLKAKEEENERLLEENKALKELSDFKIVAITNDNFTQSSND